MFLENIDLTVELQILEEQAKEDEYYNQFNSSFSIDNNEREEYV